MSLGKRSQGCALFFTPPESGRKFFAEWNPYSMRVECGFFLSAVKFLRGWLKKVCKKFRKSIAVLNLLVIFANEIKT